MAGLQSIRTSDGHSFRVNSNHPTAEQPPGYTIDGFAMEQYPFPLGARDGRDGGLPLRTEDDAPEPLNGESESDKESEVHEKARGQKAGRRRGRVRRTRRRNGTEVLRMHLPRDPEDRPLWPALRGGDDKDRRTLHEPKRDQHSDSEHEDEMEAIVIEEGRNIKYVFEGVPKLSHELGTSQRKDASRGKKLEPYSGTTGQVARRTAKDDQENCESRSYRWTKFTRLHGKIYEPTEKNNATEKSGGVGPPLPSLAVQVGS